MTFRINLWTCDPDSDKAQLHGVANGSDFATLAEAQKVYDNPWRYFTKVNPADIHTVQLDYESKDLIEESFEYRNKAYKPSVDNDDAWRREMAMEAGMAFGCNGFNDMMGY